MAMQKREINPIKVLAVKHTGAYPGIGNAFHKLFDFAMQNNLFTPGKTKSYAMYWDDPETVPEEKLRSAACLTIDEDIETPEGYEVIEIPGGKYVVSYHECQIEGFPAEWEKAMTEFYESEFEMKEDGVTLEEYLNNPEEHPEKLNQFNIWIPIL